MIAARRRAAALAVAFLAAACGSEQPGEPDAAYGCEGEGAASGQLSELGVGTSVDGEFVPLADGGEVTLVRGNQGFYMILLDARAAMDLDTPSDTVCLQCAEAVHSVNGSFESEVPLGSKFFYHLSGTAFETGLIFVLGDDLASYSGAEVTMTLDCAGHGMSAAVSRTFRLLAPPE